MHAIIEEKGHKQQRKKEAESKKKKHNHLLDIVKTSRFRFQYGSMMKHFIESNPKEDYIKLQKEGGKKKRQHDMAERDREKSDFSL